MDSLTKEQKDRIKELVRNLSEKQINEEISILKIMKRQPSTIFADNRQEIEDELDLTIEYTKKMLERYKKNGTI